MGNGAAIRRRDAGLVLVLAIVLTVVLPYLPYGRVLAYPLLLLSTLAHELGHGFTALAVGGDFRSFRMWADGSGVANADWSHQPSRIQAALVAAGGLVGPAFVAMAFLAAASRGQTARLCLAATGLILLGVDVLLVPWRNSFALAFIGLTAAMALLLAWKAGPWLAQAALVFASVQLAMAVFTRADYLFTPVAQTAAGTMPSDVQQIARALILPYWFWGGGCALISLICLGAGFRAYLQGR